MAWMSRDFSERMYERENNNAEMRAESLNLNWTTFFPPQAWDGLHANSLSEGYSIGSLGK